jgi:hypothetical protein
MQLVKEHINFERGLDPKEAMNIGTLRKLQKGDSFVVKDIFNYVKKGINKTYNATAIRDEKKQNYAKRFVNFDMNIKPNDVSGENNPTAQWYATVDSKEKCWIIGHTDFSK